MIDEIDAKPDAVAVTFAGRPRAVVVAGNVEGDGGPEGPGRIAIAVVR